MVTMLLLLVKWWQRRPQEWQEQLNYAWDLDNGCPTFKPAVSLKVYLKKLANALVDYKNIELAELANSASYLEAYLLTKSAQHAIFNKKVISELLPMLVKAGCLQRNGDNWA